MKIGFVGLGNMGGPMAANLVKAGHTVRGYDLAPRALQGFAENGGIPTQGAAEAVGDAELVITMLPAGAHVRAAYLGEGGLLAAAPKAALLIDSSTIDVETARAVAAVAAEQGFEMLDAPVSGGVGGAAAGTLTFMVGGGETAFARALPILQSMGKTIVHTGPSGNGQATKICNNMILAVSMIGVCEGFALAERLGVDWQVLFDVTSKSSGQCWAITSYCPVPGPVPASPANRDYQAGFTTDMMLKDLKLAQQAAQASGAATPLGAEAAALYQMLANAGMGPKDFSAIFRLLRSNQP
ncbi:MAG: 3-hydroxyisobutyrate dehydrogenase [Alphaproteobacteria bacterium]|nr:3-hydroxyisobutyrate dehydrogenase [Alphaproteobacteria bacterium]MBV9863135.1 3-hydroxyisobutyrate dehydrogenase [Alphaproteobacteria bacterium]